MKLIKNGLNYVFGRLKSLQPHYSKATSAWRCFELDATVGMFINQKENVLMMVLEGKKSDRQSH